MEQPGEGPTKQGGNQSTWWPLVLALGLVLIFVSLLAPKELGPFTKMGIMLVGWIAYLTARNRLSSKR